MLVVSACLAGVPCRMDGKSKPDPAIVDLAVRGEVILVCPEVLGGLPTPRIPSERKQDGRIVNAAGEDVSDQFLLGAKKALEICRSLDCRCAILKARSPSCGKGSIYDGSFSGRLISGDGVFAELLQKAGINVVTEEEFREQNKSFR